VKFRTYHEVPGADRSGLGAQVGAQRERVRDRLARVRRLVAVASGKGGVGKSYVTAALAQAVAARGRAVGVLDADLAGPTAARLLGAAGPVLEGPDGVAPATGDGGIRVFSTDLLLDEGAPLRWREPGSERFVWRSTLEAGALREFLADVAWGELDLLLVDLPPGTDRLQDLAELANGRAEVVAVTIPSAESRRAVARALRAAAEAGLPLLGLVENMDGYACSACAAVGPLFPGDAADALASEFGIPVLGRLPFRPGAPPAEAAPALAPIAAALAGAAG